MPNDTAIDRIARALSVLPREILLVIDLIQGTCNDGFARDLATFVKSLSSDACRVVVLGKERAFRHLSALDCQQIGVRSIDVRGFNFDEFTRLVSRRHSSPDYTLLHDLFRRVTAGRAAGLYAKLARSLAYAPSIEAMRDLARKPADEVLEYAEQQRFVRVSESARSAAEKLVCFALPFQREEAEEVFPGDNVGAAVRELLTLGLLRATGDGGYEMHETVRSGLEGTISLRKRQEAHGALAAYYAAGADVTAEVFHLERAGRLEEAQKRARAVFLQGKRWAGLTGFVTANELVTASEVIGVLAGSVKVEGIHLLTDILSQLKQPIDAQDILTLLREQPQRFLGDFEWGHVLVDACLRSDPSRLHELICFCLEIESEPDRRESGITAILIAARRHDCVVGSESLSLFDVSTPTVKRLLIPLLLAESRRESLARALSFIAQDASDEPGHRHAFWPVHGVNLRTQDEVIEFLAALPTVPDHAVLTLHSPLLGPLDSFVWRYRQPLGLHCVDLLQSEGVEPAVQKAAIRVLVLLGEPRLCALCEALAVAKENPIHGFAALAPTLVPTQVDRDQYVTTLLNSKQDIGTRMVALSILAAVGADLGALYEQLKIIEGNSDHFDGWDFLFLQNAAKAPFAAAIPLLESQLWSAEVGKVDIYFGALVSLGRLPDSAATSMLLKALSHPKRSVRAASILSLGNKRTKTALVDLKDRFRSERDSTLSVSLAAAIVASGAESVADLGAASRESNALSLWRCVLAARTRDVAFAPQLVELANNINANWQLRRAAINAAGFLPFEAALLKMLPIFQERSPLLIDDHWSLHTHRILSWLLLTESRYLLPVFTNGRARFVALVGGILDDTEDGLIDDRGLAPEVAAADWLYDRLKMHGWPENPGAPDIVVNELHIPLLHRAILRALGCAARSDLIEAELARADHVWIATKCLIELSYLGSSDANAAERFQRLVRRSPVADDPRLQMLTADLSKTRPQALPATGCLCRGAPEEPKHVLLSYDEAVLALNGNGPALNLGPRAPIVLDTLTFEQFGHLVRLSDPVNDCGGAVAERYAPGITLSREGYSVAQWQRTYSSGVEAAGRWIRPAVVAANRFELTIQWHEEILSGAYANIYAERLIACLSAKGDAEVFYRTLYQAPQLLGGHLCSRVARQRIANFVDDRIIPFLTMHLSSGTDEVFEGLCGLARALDSPAVDPVLSALFRRWTAHFAGRQTPGLQPTSHHLWCAFRDLTEHPRFDRVKDWHELLTPVLFASLAWYEKQEVTRVLERDPRSYIQLESLLFKSEDWEHFYEDEIDRLQEAAERLFWRVTD